MIEILRAGAQASVQDLGRTGFRHVGVGLSGALDPVALRVGNCLLGNDERCAAVEFTLGRASMRFHADLRVALAGAECGASLDGAPVWSWHAFDVRRGQTLTLMSARGGTRSYLCVAGGIDVPEVMGSRSTDLKAGFGGFAGRALREGDRLPVANASPSPAPAHGVAAPDWALQLGRTRKTAPLRVLPGPEYADFEPAAQAALWSGEWTLTPNSNRMGLRLAGTPLARRPERSADLLSHGVLPGVIQVPPAGQPIVLMADAQTTGGYPKIGTVIRADLWRLAQTPLGATIRFEQVTLEQAAQAWELLERYLRQIGQALQWQRDGLGIAARRRAGAQSTQRTAAASAVPTPVPSTAPATTLATAPT